MPSWSATVVGAGIVGLTTAETLLSKGVPVRIVTEHDVSSRDKVVTSRVAGAIVLPGDAVSTATLDHSNAWATRTLEVLDLKIGAGEVWVSKVRGLRVWPEVADHPDVCRRPWWAGHVGFEVVGPDALSAAGVDTTAYASAHQVTCPVIESDEALRVIAQQLVSRGCSFENGVTVKSLQSLDKDEFAQRNGGHVIFNCTGLGARELVGDDSMFAVRGQIVKVTAPPDRTGVWIAAHRGRDAFAHVFPRKREGTLLLGGVAQEGKESLLPSPGDIEGIRARTARLCPFVSEQREVEVVTGLRPCRRGGPRVEAEILGGAHVVHNYGHGGSGWTFAWGAAETAVALAESAAPLPRDQPSLRQSKL